MPVRWWAGTTTAWWLASLMICVGQTSDPYAQVRQSMEQAVALQRQAVLKQAGVASGDSGGFFLLPWPKPSVAPPPAIPPNCQSVDPLQLEDAIQSAAREHGLTPDLLRAIIQRESAFQPCAVSSKGALGLMQLMPSTAAELSVADPFDPGENVRAGARYLRWLLQRYDGDLTLALAAYNAGPTQVDLYGGVPPFDETLRYVREVMQLLFAGNQVQRVDSPTPVGR